MSETTLQLDEGPVYFWIDWSEILNYIDYFTDEDAELDALSDSKDVFYITCRVQAPVSNKARHFHYVEYLLHQIFLALNLSLPGCCSFYNTIVHSEDSVVEKPLGLYSDDLGTALDLSCRQGWPPMSLLPLQDTWRWLQWLTPTVKQVAQTNIEKALFSLLHVCLEEGTTPSRLIWLAHALEAVFDTPESSISKALRDRSFLVLGTPEQNTKRTKRSIESFYGLRSAFVHGGLGIVHPLANDLFDEGVNDFIHKVMDESDFALALLLATLQLFIRNNWTELEFKETYFGR